MKKPIVTYLVLLIALVLTTLGSYGQKAVNWTEKQLMEPAELARVLEAGKEIPLIVSVGPGTTIPHSRVVGMLTGTEGLEKLEKELTPIDKNRKIVIYCGCCPFEHCPNVRPAIETLQKMKFTNYYLLNLPHNIKRDWIDKGYPISRS